MIPNRPVFALLALLVTFSGAFALVPETTPSGRFSMPADAPPDLTPARLQMKKMLEAFNSGSREVLEKYREHNLSPFWLHPPDNDAALAWQKSTGGWIPVAIEDKSRTGVVALLRNVDSDDLFMMGVGVELLPPHRLISIELEYATDAPERFWPEQVSDEEAMDLLRADLARRVSLGKFSGAVLVSHEDQVLFRQGFGFADRETDTPNTPETRFRIGAMGNMFTAVALMRLVQDGKLALSDTVGKLLPGLANEDVGRLTLEQLLTNTGGTDDVEHLGSQMDLRKLRTHSDYVAEFGDSELLYRPGQRFKFSTLGYILLGAVIEHATGHSYYDYVRDVVYRPAGMTRTDALPEDEPVDGRAMPYRREPGTEAWVASPELMPYRGTAAGNGYSTVDDLARFVNALQSHRLLDARHTGMLLEPRVRVWGHTNYCYGFVDERYGNTRHWISHGGGIEGQNGELLFSPETGHVIVVLANFDEPIAKNVARFVAARLPGPEYGIPHVQLSANKKEVSHEN
jgi:CubicO group peptidase (beta-lactamase class C family)